MAKKLSSVNIGTRREVFWDDTLIDRAKTTTTARLHEPVRRECSLTYDEDWGGDTVCFNVVLQDGDLYRMYTRISCGKHDGNVGYAESRDGIHWEKPNLGICDWYGSTDNNLLFPIDHYLNAFHPFIDTNPDCPPEERYKAIGDRGEYDGGPLVLFLYTSPDGIHFTEKGPLHINGQFDSVNTVFWNPQTETYQAFVRDYHPAGEPEDHCWVRDIRFSETDRILYKDWPSPQPLMYTDSCDWHLYINSVMKYYRADHVYIGFPSRYVNRRNWNECYDELCGRENRRTRFETMDPRTALAISDTLFMTSRDGMHWKRYDEAFIRPGPEYTNNWVYGSVYFSNGIVETKSEHPGCDSELSFYCGENRWSKEPGQIWRYSIRMDGFVSQHAPYPEAKIVTKPLIYEGDELYANFSTSAYGHVRFEIECPEEKKKLVSLNMFGDSTDKHIRFPDGKSPAEFKGKEVIITVHMCDADLYSMIFRTNEEKGTNK